MSSYALFTDGNGPEIWKLVAQFSSLLILYTAHFISFSPFVNNTSYNWLMFGGMIFLSAGLFCLAGKLNFVVHAIFALLSLVAMYFVNRDNSDSDGKIGSGIMIFVSLVSTGLLTYSAWAGEKSSSDKSSDKKEEKHSVTGFDKIMRVLGALGSVAVLAASIIAIVS